MTDKNQFRYLFLSLIIALALTGLAVKMTQATSPAAVQTGGVVREVVVALHQEPDTLYIHGGSTLAATTVLNAIMDGPFTILNYAYQTTILTKVPNVNDGDEAIQTSTILTGSMVVDDNGDVITLTPGVMIRPAGCRSSACAIAFDGSPVQMDQMLVTFTLRNGIRWSDGVSLTLQDALFSQQIACDPDTPISKYTCERTANYAATGEFTATWTGLPGYVNPDAALSFWTPLPHHVLSNTTASELLNGDYGRHPLGWGPFKITEWITGSHITLERNPYYWRPGYPKLDRVIFRFMTNPDEAYRAMLRGEVLVATQSTNVAENHISDLFNPDVNRVANLLWTTDAYWEHMDFGILPADSRYAFFADPQVRHAVAYAINRQRLIDQVLYGLGAVPNAYIPPEHPLYTTTLATYPYSPTQAAAMLEAAGWVDTNANDIRDKDGREFIITYSTNSADVRTQTGALIQEDLAAVGIQVNLDFQPFTQFLGDGPDGTCSGRKFDLATYAWVTGVEPRCRFYLSSEIPAEANTWAGSNTPGYNNPAYDAACEQALSALPGTPDYIHGHQTAMQLLAEDLPALPLFYHLKMAATSTALSMGPKLDPTENAETWNIWQWDVTAETMATPGAETFLVAPNHILTGTFPTSAFTDTAILTWTNLLPLPAPFELAGVARYFNLEAVAQTTAMLPIEPQQPYTLTITYAQASLPTSVNEDTLKLYYWNGGSWEPEPTSQVDTVANIVSATPNHLGTWAILGIRPRHDIYLPLVLRGG
ncbi:MAG: peptide ABC transporter substrate-binding protein [Anaerolineae bacterium]|nr:peptide ABC transporter substrate-binding protein [Anaerolineae bacterium]